MYLISLLTMFFLQLTPAYFSDQNCDSSENYLQIASVYLEQRNFEESIQALDCLIELEPDNSRAYLFYATNYFRLGEIEDALTSLDQFVQLAEENSEPIAEGLLLRVNILKLVGRYDDVLELSPTLIQQIEEEHDSSTADVLIATVNSIIAEVYIYQDQPEEAINSLDASIELNEDSAWSHFWRSIANDMLGNRDQSQQDLEEAMHLSPDLYLRMSEEASTYRALGNDEQVVRFFTYAIQLNTGDDTILLASYALRGEAYFELGQFEDAVSDFTTVLELSPEQYPAYFIRGCARVELGETTRAVTDLSRYITINPQFPDTYLCRANAYYANGNGGRALRDYIRYQELAEQSGIEVNPLAIERIAELDD